jgi:hypothetical protein
MKMKPQKILGPLAAAIFIVEIGGLHIIGEHSHENSFQSEGVLPSVARILSGQANFEPPASASIYLVKLSDD